MANKENLISGLTTTGINSSATSISVSFDTDTDSGNATASSSSDALPDVPFFATLSPVGVVPNLLNSEIVSVTAKTWNSSTSCWDFTIARAQKSTTARAFAEGSVFTNGVYTDDIPEGIKTLTTADYNYPTTGTKTSVALWLLPAGVYAIKESGVVYQTTNLTTLTSLGSEMFLTAKPASDTNAILTFSENLPRAYYVDDGGQEKTFSSSATVVNASVLLRKTITDDLTSNKSDRPLSAKQGKVLKDLIDSLVIKNAGAPTTATVGTVGMLLEDTTNGKLYQCTAIDTSVTPNTYTWEEVGAGGGGGDSPLIIDFSSSDTSTVTRAEFANAWNNKRLIAVVYNYCKVGFTVGHSTMPSGQFYVHVPLLRSPFTPANASAAEIEVQTLSIPSSDDAYITRYGTAFSTYIKPEDSLTSTSTSRSLSANQGKVLKDLIDGSAIGTTETLTIADTDWSTLSSSDPYTYSATKTLTATIGANSTVELINDNAVSFGTYGFAIGAVDQPNNTVTVYSIGSPSASVNLKINVKGA